MRLSWLKAKKKLILHDKVVMYICKLIPLFFKPSCKNYHSWVKKGVLHIL